MPTQLTVADLVSILARHGELLGVYAQASGPGAGVPSCPGWTVHDLLEHQAMVHRWAAGQLSGTAKAAESEQATRVNAADSLLDSYRTGLRSLIGAIENAADDLAAMVFLLDAPAPRQFWARRQAQETTIHSTDALAAKLGRLPTADETGIETAAAVDGIDELLHGFLPRRSGKLRSDRPFALAIEPTDAARRWLLAIGPEAVVTTEGAGPADETFTGTAAQLYLGLWNRGDEISGSAAVLRQWRDQAKVSWR